MMTSDDKVGGWVKKGQNHDDVILECPHTYIMDQQCCPNGNCPEIGNSSHMYKIQAYLSKF